MLERKIRLLVINPGGTSTKVAVYENEKELKRENIKHPSEVIAGFPDMWDEYEYRKNAVLNWVKTNGYKLHDFNAIVSRGGIIKPVASGVYLITEEMLADMKSGKYGGKHQCSVGCKINFSIAQELGIPSLTVDPPASNELWKIATYSGNPQIWRRGSFHVLNQKAIARRLAQDLGKDYKEIKVVIVHLGTGISVGAHYLGRVVDVNNSLDGDGPFSLDKSGDLPVGDLIKLCYSGKYSEAEMLKQNNGQAGLLAYLGTTDGVEIEARIKNGDEKAKEVIEAMVYQIAKEIGAMSVALKGGIEAIGLTGGLANWERLVNLIKDWVSHIAPIYTYPGENELESLALGALRYLRGEEQLKEYALGR